MEPLSEIKLKKKMEPKFKTFENNDSLYELYKYGESSFIKDFEPFKDEWRTKLKVYPDTFKNFIPCPFCIETKNSVLSFVNYTENGTNTSGGTDSIVYEVQCADCNKYSLFEKIENRYPYD